MRWLMMLAFEWIHQSKPPARYQFEMGECCVIGLIFILQSRRSNLRRSL